MTTLTTTPPTLNLAVPDENAETVLLDAAADIGNARSVFLVRLGEQIKQVVMPSVRSLHGVSSFELFTQRGLPRESWGQLSADEHIIARDGVERFVGRLAVECAPAASSGRGSDERYSDGTTLDFVLVSVAAALPKATMVALRLVTIVPISLWPLIGAQVEHSLKGSHRYRYKGREIVCKLEQVVCRREAEVAYFWIAQRSPQAANGRTLIVDGGGRTVNVALFSDGVYKGGATIDNMGVEAALDAVDKDLMRDSARPLTLGERIGLLEAMRNDQPYSIVVRSSRVRIDSLARRHFDAAALALVQELHAKVKVEAAEQGAFIGGAAYPQFFGAVVHERLPILDLAREPELENVRGALASLGGAVKKAKRR